MPALSNATDIKNMALDHLGEEAIMGETDNRPAVKFMNRWYEHARNALLETAYWRFARKRASLSAAASEPAFEWAYSYTLPSDFLKLIPPTADGYLDGPILSYDIEGQNILTNSAAPLLIRYIAQITDPTKFTTLFTEALALFLALRGASKITGKQGYREALSKDFDRALLNAQVADGMMGDMQKPLADDWETARYAGP